MVNLTTASATRAGRSARFRSAVALSLSLGLAATLGGCSTADLGRVHSQKLAAGEVPIQIGPAVRDNRTPMEAALACYGDHLRASGAKPLIVSVGDVKDYTGKYSINEGNAITQGGALMVYSALGKLDGAVRLAERFDPVIAERELGYMDRRQLGDGSVHEVNGQRVPWMPYYGGSIASSDYFIVGGITELNYNIRSGGTQFAINNIGVQGRVYNQSVAVDLRIVNSRTLIVEKTISLQKQFTGYEVGANTFRFFGLDLFDINIGEKGQEPLQLGVRTALEEAAMRLVGAVTGTDPTACLTLRTGRVPEQTAAELKGRAAAPGFSITAPAPAPPPADERAEPAGRSLNAIETSGGAPSGSAIQVAFEFGDATLNGPSQAIIDRIAAAAKQGGIEVTLVARDTENWDPGKRDSLIDQRIAALVAALANRGIAPGAVTITWRPDKADTSIHRDGPGLQEIAKLRIGS